MRRTLIAIALRFWSGGNFCGDYKLNDKTFDFTSERDFVSRAHCVGLNLQATLQWNEVNEDAISALNEFAEETGCFSDEYRKF